MTQAVELKKNGDEISRLFCRSEKRVPLFISLPSSAGGRAFVRTPMIRSSWIPTVPGLLTPRVYCCLVVDRYHKTAVKAASKSKDSVPSEGSHKSIDPHDSS